ncbi:MAG TPA: hypothetical protein VK074_02270 [Fodinibius sp.]|nr:hypothetical protein [Fodinibius sp.]
MKISKIIIFSVTLILATATAGYGQSDEASERIKTYVNKVVQKVERAEDSDQKRAILNDSFDKMTEAFDRVASMEGISSGDKEGIDVLRKDIQEKRNELNGLDGYNRIADNQLNKFANYVQQDMEQADTITISVTTLLLIIIILLLL